MRCTVAGAAGCGGLFVGKAVQCGPAHRDPDIVGSEANGQATAARWAGISGILLTAFSA